MISLKIHGQKILQMTREWFESATHHFFDQAMRFGVLRVAHFEAPLIYKPAIQTTIKTQKTQKEDQKVATATA